VLKLIFKFGLQEGLAVVSIARVVLLP